MEENAINEMYTREQVEHIIEKAETLETEVNELRKQTAYLKSCINCKIRKKCKSHSTKVLHDCDHWEHGEPTGRGEWIVCGDGEYVPSMCTVCGKISSWHTVQSAKYCPNWGAEMDGN